MLPEIADSDGESDLNSPLKRRAAHENRNEDPLQSLASPSPIDFNEYLDATPRLSSSASHHVTDFNQLDGSADITATKTADLQSTSLFGEVLPGMMSKKRAHSAFQDGLGDLQHEKSGRKPKMKRSKTYSAASRSRTAQDDNLFALPSKASLGPRNLESTGHDGDAGDQATSTIHPVSANPNIPILTGTSARTEVFPLRKQSFADSTHCMTTSIASMGHHQSINIDFRGSAQGLSVNANPFGSLSQVSFEEDNSQAKPEYLMDMAEIEIEIDEARSTQIAGNYHTVSVDGPWQDQPLQALLQPYLERPLAINPPPIMQKDGVASNANDDSHVYAPETANDIGDPPTAAEDALPSMEKSSVPKKRGRKAKNSRLPSKSPPPSLNEDPVGLAFTTLPNPTRAREGTMESLSQASQTSATNAPSRKWSRRKSKQIDEEGPEESPAESSSMKHPTSELNLSNELVIELPKEAYKPRPSRSRSKIIVEGELEQAVGDSSLAKHPTSELNLSDEAVIGLPKESYKPRPSRTRSKKDKDEDTTLLPPLEADDDCRTPAKPNGNDVAEQETPNITSTKSSTKKGRKSKVKRAKTSAAALFKKADPMLSEGEEDVVWMDSKPAPVKLDLPPDFNALKIEPDVFRINDEHKRKEKSEQATSAKSTNITIEIPIHTQVKDPVVEPKKRGRRPKKGEHKQEEQKTTEEKEDEPESNTISRSPLAEKSRNIPASTSNDLIQKGFIKAPTVSPIKSPEPEAEKQTQPETLSGKDKRNEPITTPAKPKPSALPSSTEKGPTKHSPINPPSLSSSGRKVIYRVGLSRRQNIPSLLRKVDRDKPPPKIVPRKEKDSKKKKDMDAVYDGEGGDKAPGEMRGPDGMLIEWEF